MQGDAQQRGMDLQVAVVVDEAQPPELVHEGVNARPGRADELRQRLLADHNEFISELRRARPTISIDDPAAQAKSHPPLQENGLIMREFMAAFGQLPDARRQALLFATVDGQPYDQIARRAGVSVGAVKSRVRRAREMLKRLLYSP